VDKHREPKALRWSRALRDYMSDHDLTVEQVARAAGRSPGYVSHRTTGRASLSLDIILAVADLTGISERALMIELTDRVGWEPGSATTARPGTASLPSDRPGDAG
jgi:transcriptional regulator with XRE-family HTH domain